MATVICIPLHDGSFKFHVKGHLPEHYTLRPPDVSSVSGRIMYFPKEHQPVSTPLQNGLRFFLHVNPEPQQRALRFRLLSYLSGSTRFPRSA